MFEITFFDTVFEAVLVYRYVFIKISIFFISYCVINEIIEYVTFGSPPEDYLGHTVCQVSE